MSEMPTPATATPEQRERAYRTDFRSNTERDAYAASLEQRITELERLVKELDARTVGMIRFGAIP